MANLISPRFARPAFGKEGGGAGGGRGGGGGRRRERERKAHEERKGADAPGSIASSER